MLKQGLKGYVWGYVEESRERWFLMLRSSECLKVICQVRLKRVFKGYFWGYVKASV